MKTFLIGHGDIGIVAARLLQSHGCDEIVLVDAKEPSLMDRQDNVYVLENHMKDIPKITPIQQSKNNNYITGKKLPRRKKK